MKDTIIGWVHNANLKVSKRPVGRYFRLEHSGHIDSSSPKKFQEVLTRFENSQKNRRELFLYEDKSCSGNLLRYGLHDLCQREHYLSVWWDMRLPIGWPGSLRHRPCVLDRRPRDQQGSCSGYCRHCSIDKFLHGLVC